MIREDKGKAVRGFPGPPKEEIGKRAKKDKSMNYFMHIKDKIYRTKDEIYRTMYDIRGRGEAYV